MSNITIKEIEALFKLVIEKLEKDKLSQIEFSTDEYWIVMPDDWADFKKEPTPVIGSIKEDVEYLKIAIEENAIYSYMDFETLGRQEVSKIRKKKWMVNYHPLFLSLRVPFMSFLGGVSDYILDKLFKHAE